jgi:hypothetical protein
LTIRVVHGIIRAFLYEAFFLERKVLKMSITLTFDSPRAIWRERAINGIKFPSLKDLGLYDHHGEVKIRFSDSVEAELDIIRKNRNPNLDMQQGGEPQLRVTHLYRQTRHGLKELKPYDETEDGSGARAGGPLLAKNFKLGGDTLFVVNHTYPIWLSYNGKPQFGRREIFVTVIKADFDEPSP